MQRCWPLSPALSPAYREEGEKDRTIGRWLTTRGLTAPAGRRFVVIEAAVANRLPTAQVFEPDQFSGRAAALYLYDAGGERLSPEGPDLVDYSAQDLPATALVPLALAGTRLPPPHPAPIPLGGELVFSYPSAELRRARTREVVGGSSSSAVVPRKAISATRSRRT